MLTVFLIYLRFISTKKINHNIRSKRCDAFYNIQQYNFDKKDTDTLQFEPKGKAYAKRNAATPDLCHTVKCPQPPISLSLFCVWPSSGARISSEAVN